MCTFLRFLRFLENPRFSEIWEICDLADLPIWSSELGRIWDFGKSWDFPEISSFALIWQICQILSDPVRSCQILEKVCQSALWRSIFRRFSGKVSKYRVRTSWFLGNPGKSEEICCVELIWQLRSGILPDRTGNGVLTGVCLWKSRDFWEILEILEMSKMCQIGGLRIWEISHFRTRDFRKILVLGACSGEFSDFGSPVWPVIGKVVCHKKWSIEYTSRHFPDDFPESGNLGISGFRLFQIGVKKSPEACFKSAEGCFLGLWHACVSYVWAMCDMCVAYVWHVWAICGICVSYVWHMWAICGICVSYVSYVWAICELCVTYVSYVWHMCAMMRYVWVRLETANIGCSALPK